MVTCFLKYTIDPQKVNEFEHYGKMWIDLVNNMGGIHHGYLKPELCIKIEITTINRSNSVS